MDSEEIGFIGLGAMGLPMARNLASTGFPLRVFNRTKGKASDISGRIKEVANPADAVSPGGIVITMLADDQAVRSVAYGEKGFGEKLGAGSIHLSMSTISPQLARELAEEHARRGAWYVAAPVSGRPDAAAAKQLILWVSGEQNAKARVAPLLAAMGQRSFDLGDSPWAGNVAKLAANVLVLNTVEVLGEVFTLLEKNAVSAQVFSEAISGSLFPSPVFKTYGALLAGAKTLAGPGFKLKLALKDIELAMANGSSAQVPMPSAALLRDRLLAGVANGHGEEDLSVIGRQIREAAGI